MLGIAARQMIAAVRSSFLDQKPSGKPLAKSVPGVRRSVALRSVWHEHDEREKGRCAPMSTDVEPRSSWQQMAAAIDRASGLIEQIPGWDSYQCAPESDLELRAAAALVQRAVLYLGAAAAREAPRLEAMYAEFEARGELPPWDRDAKRVVEDSD